MLEIKNLTKEYFMGFKLDDVSFGLEPGYIMGFIGPNGAGKSTTIKLIMNLIKKDSGQINIFGMDHVEEEKKIKDRIGFVYDEPYFYENFTIERMKNIIAPFYSKWDDELFYDYLKKFELKANYQIKKLSKGMKMKFAIAVAISHHAELLILDEPTAGLDPIVRREILDILHGEILSSNTSILISTHIISDIENIADYITYLNNGKLVFSETKDDLLARYKIVKGDSKFLINNMDKFIGSRQTDLGFVGLTKDIDRMDAKEDIIIESPSIEDIMYYYRGE